MLNTSRVQPVQKKKMKIRPYRFLRYSSLEIVDFFLAIQVLLIGVYFAVVGSDFDALYIHNALDGTTLPVYGGMRQVLPYEIWGLVWMIVGGAQMARVMWATKPHWLCSTTLRFCVATLMSYYCYSQIFSYPILISTANAAVLACAALLSLLWARS